MSTYSATTQDNYQKFVAGLTLLTRKYGVAIQSIGGVSITNTPYEFSRVIYKADITSGDLEPEFPGDGPTGENIPSETARVIAQRYLHIDTLERRLSDSLDFHEVSVWAVQDALQAAYNEGLLHAACGAKGNARNKKR